MPLQFVAALLAVIPGTAAAQHIATDGTLGIAKVLAGPNYNVDAGLGKQVGGNLFHSFGKFGLNTGESANFSGPNTVANIIGRVTGGSLSSIDGAINSSIPKANLYLINPSGMVFGPHATVNVSGSFHASTADYVKMSDGAKFRATNPGGSTLSAAPPAAFGFLNAAPPSITVDGSQLGPVPGTLGLVGGPVTIKNGAKFSAPAGTIHVTAVAGAGEVPVDPTDAASLTVTHFAPVTIAGGSVLSVSDPTNFGSGGSVFIRAGSLTIDASNLDGDNYGVGAGGQLALRADSGISLSNGASVHANALSSGAGAAISVIGEALTLAAGAQISSATAGMGDGGSVAVRVGGTLAIRGGGAGDPLPTGIFSDARGNSTGNSGRVSVAAGSANLTLGGAIGSSTFSSGRAGDIAVGVAGDLTIDGLNGGTEILTGIFAQANPTPSGAARPSTGDAGRISVTAGRLAILNSGEISSATKTSGHGGTVAVAVAGDLTIDGATLARVGRKVIETGILANTGIINQPATGGGPAGDVTVSAASMTLRNFGHIASDTWNDGLGGNVSVSTGDGVLTTSGSLRTRAFAGGDAGSIALSASNLTINQYGVITGATFGAGKGGNVVVSVADRLTIDDGLPLVNNLPTGIVARSGTVATGDAGTVAVRAGTLSIGEGGVIQVRTETPGNAGTVSVSAGTLALGRDGVISSDTVGAGSGNAGSVSVAIGGGLSIDGAGQTIFTGISSQSTFDAALGLGQSDGNAGTVSVDAGTLSIVNGGAISTSTGGRGGGGDVSLSIAGDAMLTGAGTAVTASATGPQSGAGGSVNVQAASLSIGGGGQIASSTAGPGNGGDIAIVVGGDVVLSGQGPQITAQSTGSGDAGSIALSAANLNMTGGAAISTQAATANGGNISLHIGHFMELVDSEVTTSVNGAFGNGGNILIDPQFLILLRSDIIAQAIEGHGGNITIVADNFFPSADSIVSASSQLGISGTIDIVGPRVDLNGSLVVLASELRRAAEVLRNSCAARSGLPRSSLTEAGRGGLPQDPEATIPALYLAGRDVMTTAAVGAPFGMPATPVASRQSRLRVAMHCGG